MSFQQLQAQWYQKLKHEGFVDIESKSVPKGPEKRTLLFQNRDIILDFYLKLDEYLTNKKRLPQPHRTILTQFSDGVKITLIAKSLDLKYECVRAVIRKYKKIIINS